MIDINESKEFTTWFIEAQKIIDEHWKRLTPSLPLPEFTCTQGRKYIRIIKGSSVYGFIDRTNGDVLKAASWKTPAKNFARGNIFSTEDGGLSCCNPYSIG